VRDHGAAFFAASTAVDAALVCGALLLALRQARTGWRWVAALGLVLVALALKGVALVATGLDIPFGVMHVLWLDLIVVAPLAALLALRTWPSARPALRAAVVLALLLAPVGAYASLIEPDRLVTERARVPLADDRTGRAPLKIAVIADLQFEQLGSHEREAIEHVLAERPDLILLAGDYHQGSRLSFERQLPDVHRLLSKLHAPGGVFAVQGDCESIGKAEEVFAGTGIRLLVDETARVRVRDRTVSIAGIELRYWLPRARAAMRRLEEAPGREDVRLLLSHRPDPVLRAAAHSRIDLFVAGHTHGGQLQLPFVGPLSTATHVSRAVAAGGLHEVDGNRLYVSRGIGVERGQAPRLRLGAPPEVSILELR